MRKSCVALGVYGRIHQGDDQSLHSQHILGGSQQKRRQKSPNLRWSTHRQKLSKFGTVSGSTNLRQVFFAGKDFVPDARAMRRNLLDESCRNTPWSSGVSRTTIPMPAAS